MRKLFTIISFITAIMTCAQTTQTGLVQEYNERAKKTPLAGVELNVRSAGNTVSDQKGEFSLQFLTLKPGEKVNVRRIEKLGYEIFNKEAVEQWNINPKTPFVIIMCRSDRFKKIRDNYEKVSSESYARQLKKEEAALAKLKEDGKIKEREYEQRLVELRENFDRQLDNLENYVDRFSRIDLSEISGVEQDIIRLVQEGKIEEAIAKYEEQNFVSKYTEEVSQLKKVSSAIDQLSDVKAAKEQTRDSLYAAIDRHVETLRLAGGKNNFDKIEVILHDIAYTDTTASLPMWKYLNFMSEQNKYNQIGGALDTYLNQNLSNSDRIRGMELRIRTFINLADFSGHDDFVAELDSLIDINVKSDPANDVLFKKAEACFRIGGFYLESDQLLKALPYLQKTVNLLSDSIVSEIVKDNLDYLGIYLQSHIAYAYANLKVGNNKEFEQGIIKPRDLIIARINGDFPDSQNIKIIKSIVDLGQLLELNKRFDEADVLYQYSASIYSENIQKNPNKYLPLLANLNMVLGILNAKTNKFAEAESYYLKALDNYSTLAKDLPKKYRMLQKKVYNNLSALYLANKSFDKSVECATKSYSIVLDYYREEPQYYQSELLSAFTSMGRAYDVTLAKDSAEYYYRRAQDLNNQLFKESGGTNVESFWRKSIDLPYFYISNNQFEKAIPELKTVVGIGESFITKESPYYQGLQSMLYLLGRSHRICGDYKEAKTILEKFINQNPTKFLGYLEMATVQALLKNKEEDVINNIRTALKYNPDALKGMDESDVLFPYLDSNSLQ